MANHIQPPKKIYYEFNGVKFKVIRDRLNWMYVINNRYYKSSGVGYKTPEDAYEKVINLITEKPELFKKPQKQ